MKVLLDSSVLVAALVEVHEAHERALPWLQRAHAGEGETVVAAHTLAEVYAVLTRLPLHPPIGPELAWRLIREEVVATVSFTSGNTTVVSTPASITISAGAQTGSVTTITNAVASNTSVVITATANGITRKATLTVIP